LRKGRNTLRIGNGFGKEEKKWGDFATVDECYIPSSLVELLLLLLLSL
jgi:hypothetical protein